MRKQGARKRAFEQGALPHEALEHLLGDDLDTEWFLLEAHTDMHEHVAEFRKALGAREIYSDFRAGWASYLVEEARRRHSHDPGFSRGDAELLARTAYNFVEAAEHTISSRAECYGATEGGLIIPKDPGFPPRVLPSSRFREDLGFDAGDFRILHGTLSHKPLERNVGRIAVFFMALRGETPCGFYEQKTAAGMANYIFDDLQESGKPGTGE